MSYENILYSNTYNKLPEVFDADFQLIKHGRDSALNILFKIIKDHHLEKYVGIRLLHKHNIIYDDEVMVEEAIIDSDGYSLVTKASPISHINFILVPNSWVLSDAGFVPMEFSNETLVNSKDISPRTNPDFFAELAMKIRELGLSTVLGPALIPSKAVQSNCPYPSALMLEQSALDDRANVLRYVQDSNFHVDTVVETFWCINSDSDCSSEEDNKPQKKPEPMIVCKRICPSVQNPPKHQGTYIHNRS